MHATGGGRVIEVVPFDVGSALESYLRKPLGHYTTQISAIQLSREYLAAHEPCRGQFRVSAINAAAIFVVTPVCDTLALCGSRCSQNAYERGDDSDLET